MPWLDARLGERRWQGVLRRRFDRAANGYQQLALAQQASADELLQSLQDLSLPGRVLDLGCGSGHLARALAMLPGVGEVLALDISEGMLRAPEWRGAMDAAAGAAGAGAAPLHRLCADAAELPLATGSMDVLTSNFALHWCSQPLSLLRELHRVSRPDAMARLVIPVTGSLDGRTERAAIGASLRPAADWRLAADAAGWRRVAEDVADYVEYHASADAWLQALRAIGVTARRGTGQGLGGRAALAALRQRLEATRVAQGIPLRYQVWRVTLRPA